MSYLRRLVESVSEEISSGRLGQPVFTRLSLITSPDHGHLLPAAGEAVAAVGEMVSLPARSLFAGGSVESGHLTAQLDFEGGRSALVVVTTLRDELHRVDLLLIGNHGTLRHENEGNTLTQQITNEQGSFFEVTSAGRRTEAALRESLSSGGPVSVAGESDS